MDAIVEFVKEYLLPGSVTFLLLAVSVGVAALYLGARGQLWARRGLLALLIGYLALGTPLVSGWLENSLTAGFSPIEDPGQAEGATAIVVLGGGSITYRARDQSINILSGAGALRVLEGARLYRLLGDPLVITSGGMTEEQGQFSPESHALRTALVELGVPESRIIVEAMSEDTREQALNLAPILAANGIERFVLVTSPSHMRRALATFRAIGLHPIPSTAPAHSEPPPNLLQSQGEAASGLPTPGEGTDVAPTLWEPPPWLPNPESLSESQVALREVLALTYYGLRGWLHGP